VKDVFLIVLSIFAKVAIIFFLFILFLVAVDAHQNPVNYIDSVDAIQANLANQKFAEWITANEADVDTLKILNESIISLCDTTGGQTISATDSAYINFDKELIEASIYHHAVDDYAVAINQAGTYLVMARVTLHSPNSTNHTCYVQMDIKRYSASWLNVQGGMAGAYVGRLVSPSGQAFATQTVTCDEGDSIAIQIYNKSPDAAYVIQTVAEGVSLIIQKLY
jgi:hypothetical protein